MTESRNTIIKPIEGVAMTYGGKPRFRRTLEQVKLVVEDGRQSIAVLFREGFIRKPDETKEFTIVYKSVQEGNDFLSLWYPALKPEDVSRIRQHLGESISMAD